MEVTPLYHNQRPDGALLPQEEAAFGILEALGIDYDRVSSEPADTMEKCAEVSRVLGMPICKNLFLCNRQKTNFYLLMMPGDKPFKTKDLSSQLGVARLSFADEAHMEEMLDLLPGSVSIMGLANDTEHRVQLVIDREVLEGGYLGCHPCMNTSSIKLKTRDVLEKFLPAVRHTATVVDLPWPVPEEGQPG